MNKIKKVWVENKVLLVLAIILLICLAVTAGVAITYFYGASDNVYGNRLDITKKVPLDKNKLSNVESTLKENESVVSAETVLKGKIIYVNIEFVNDTKMDDAKKVSESIIPLFTEEELGVYDIQIAISSKGNNAYTLMGAHNSNGSGKIVWNNYNIAVEGSE